jgi:hypothetical protein
MKRSGRDESISVVIHLCMEAMLGISLYSSPHLNSKNSMSFSLLLMYTLQQNWRRGQNRFCLQVRRVVGRRRGAGEQGRKWPNNACTYE